MGILVAALWIWLSTPQVTVARSGQVWETLVQQFQQLYRDGKYAEALPVIREASEIARGFPPGDRRLWYSGENLAITLDLLERVDEAQQLYSDLLLGSPGSLPDPATRSRLLRNIGRIHIFKERFQDAEKFYNEALQNDAEYLGPDDARRVPGLIGAAGFFLSQQRNQDALPYAESAVELTGQLPAEDPLRLQALDLLAGTYNQMRQFDKAQPAFEMLLAIAERQYGLDHPRVVRYVENLAALNLMKGNRAAAGVYFRRVLENREKTLGPDNPALGMIINNIALTLDFDKDKAEIESLLLRALKLQEVRVGEGISRLSTPLSNLGHFYMRSGNDELAESYMRRAIEVEQSNPQSRDAKPSANSISSLAGLLMKQRRFAEAEPYAQRALEIVERNSGLSDDPDIFRHLNTLVILYFGMDEHAKALPLARRAPPTAEKFYGLDSQEYADTSFQLATALHKTGATTLAEGAFLKAIELYEKKSLPAMVAAVLRQYAELLQGMGRSDEAAKAKDRAETLSPRN